MPRHFTPAALAKLVAGPLSEAEIARAIQHLASCGKCWSTAADFLAQTKQGRHLQFRSADARSALITLIEESAGYAVEALKARAWWAEIRDLGLTEQVKKIRTISALQGLAVFEIILNEAWSTGLSDPFRGQDLAQLAFALAGQLPEPKFARILKHDLRGEALTVLANCRRLGADWQGTATAIKEAKDYLSKGTGDPGLEARLLSIHSSFCTDVGRIDEALALVRRAEEIYLDLEDYQGFAHNAVKEANTLLAFVRPTEAIEKANFALQRIPPHDLRLQVLARFILIESHVILERPLEALRIFHEAQPMWEQADLGTKLRAIYFEARLLDGLGCIRESEKLFREAIRIYFDHELYKEAFTTLLTLFECFCRRGALGKAETLCDAAIEATSQAGEACNEQIRRAWEELRATVRLRQLSDADLVHARRFLIRNWSFPDSKAAVLPAPEAQLFVGEAVPQTPSPPPPTDEALKEGGYQAALEDYDKQLIAAVLESTGGNISETSRVLGLSRNTLRSKIRRYGLS